LDIRRVLAVTFLLGDDLASAGDMALGFGDVRLTCTVVEWISQ
jgi:hypothetical protein